MKNTYSSLFGVPYDVLIVIIQPNIQPSFRSLARSFDLPNPFPIPDPQQVLFILTIRSGLSHTITLLKGSSLSSWHMYSVKTSLLLSLFFATSYQCLELLGQQYSYLEQSQSDDQAFI